MCVCLIKNVLKFVKKSTCGSLAVCYLVTEGSKCHVYITFRMAGACTAAAFLKVCTVP